MCLVTNNNKFVLDEDLYVYKMFAFEDGQISSMLYNFSYEKNFVYKTEIREIEDYQFHDEFAQQYNRNLFSNKSYGPGFHSALSIERLCADDLYNRDCYLIYQNWIIYKCRINKGAECIIDDSGLVISSSIELLTEISAIEFSNKCGAILNIVDTPNVEGTISSMNNAIVDTYNDMYQYLMTKCL